MKQIFWLTNCVNADSLWDELRPPFNQREDVQWQTAKDELISLLEFLSRKSNTSDNCLPKKIFKKILFISQFSSYIPSPIYIPAANPPAVGPWYVRIFIILRVQYFTSLTPRDSLPSAEILLIASD